MLHRPDGLAGTIPRAHKTGQRQKKSPDYLEGFAGLRVLLAMGGAMLNPPAFRLRPTDAADQTVRAFGRPRADLKSKEFESQIGCEGGANEPGSNQS